MPERGGCATRDGCRGLPGYQADCCAWLSGTWLTGTGAGRAWGGGGRKRGPGQPTAQRASGQRREPGVNLCKPAGAARTPPPAAGDRADDPPTAGDEASAADGGHGAGRLKEPRLVDAVAGELGGDRPAP